MSVVCHACETYEAWRASRKLRRLKILATRWLGKLSMALFNFDDCFVPRI